MDANISESYSTNGTGTSGIHLKIIFTENSYQSSKNSDMKMWIVISAQDFPLGL